MQNRSAAHVGIITVMSVISHAIIAGKSSASYTYIAAVPYHYPTKETMHDNGNQ